LLQLVVSGLKNNNVSTLTVIEKLMSGMTGEDIVGNFAISAEQLAAYTAGNEMCREIFYSAENTLGDRRARRSLELLSETKKSQPRLVAALRNTGLAIPILIGLARMATHSMLFDMHISVKEMGIKRDYAHEVFSQYCAFIAEQMPKDELVSLVPTLRELQDECGVEAQLAWMIIRAKLNATEASDSGMDVDDVWWPSQLSETITEVREDDGLLDRQGKMIMGT
jgi:THO complex subunit 2